MDVREVAFINCWNTTVSAMIPWDRLISGLTQDSVMEPFNWAKEQCIEQANGFVMSLVLILIGTVDSFFPGQVPGSLWLFASEEGFFTVVDIVISHFAKQ